MDALEFLKQIEDKSINLIVIDPPYNINKDSWDKIEDYEVWLKSIIVEIQRVLKENGSFYIFHSEMLVVADLISWINLYTKFIFKQFIVWNKRFDKASNKGFLDGFVVVDALRNYQQMAEYILFYSFQDDTGLSKVYADTNNFKSIRDYMIQEKIKANLKTCKQINTILEVDTNGGGMASHYFSEDAKQWTFPTKEAYLKLQSKTGYFQKTYEELEKEYKDYKNKYLGLIETYESQRYTFNNQKTHHSVWDYELVGKKGNHITPKPIELIKNIIVHSSNKGDLVLDCFMGTGTVAQACKELNRDFIGCDSCEDYVKTANVILSQTKLEVKQEAMQSEARHSSQA